MNVLLSQNCVRVLAFAWNGNRTNNECHRDVSELSRNIYDKTFFCSDIFSDFFY